ncbi:MAG TPA: Gfo/Idh/MocA family oxidoreductase [Prolixibacteraceae bacterium]|nr:Gfo/Idh/MocA family oxidoreductase [Prolixibacteraceae bacterium]
MLTEKKIRFAVVGQGHIGKRHAEMILRNPQSELAAVCDILTPEECKVSYDGIPFYRSIDELLKKETDLDVLNICSPNGLHAEMAIKALEKGIHVVIEKPMALTRADAEKVVFKSLEKNKSAFCVMQNRYSPPSVWLKNVIRQNVLGKLFHVQINCYWNRDERYYTHKNWHGDAKLDGGTLFTQFSHFIDIMYWLFGDIKNISGQFMDFSHKNLTDFEDTGIVNFEFVDEGIGALNYSTAIYGENLESSMTIIGEKGTIKVAGQYMNEVVYCNVKDYEMPELEASAPPNDYGLYKGSAQNHHLVIQNVVETLNGQTPISTNAMEGLKVVDIIERIYTVRDQVWKK